MTSTDRLVAGVIATLSAPAARLYEIKAAFGVVIDCVAFATTMEVMMATTVAKRMTPGRENFWIRIVIAFILFAFFYVGFSLFWPSLTSRPAAFAKATACQGEAISGRSLVVLQEIREKVTRKVRESLKGYTVASFAKASAGQGSVEAERPRITRHGGRLQIITASLQKETKKTKVLSRPFVPFVPFVIS